MKYYTDGRFGMPTMPTAVGSLVNPVTTVTNFPAPAPTTTIAGYGTSPLTVPTILPTAEGLVGKDMDYASWGEAMRPRSTLGGYFTGHSGMPLIDNTVGKVVQGVQRVGGQLGTDWTNMNGMQKIGSIGSTVGGLMGTYNSFKANKLAQDQMNFNKMQSIKNYEASKNTMNAQLSDRQTARVAQAQAESRATGRPVTTVSVSDYMNKYGVK